MKQDKVPHFLNCGTSIHYCLTSRDYCHSDAPAGYVHSLHGFTQSTHYEYPIILALGIQWQPNS